MKQIVILSLAALTAGCMAEEPLETRPRAQAQLAQELAGRVAGPPQSCVSSRDVRGNRSAGEGAIIFEGVTRSTIYVNRPRGGCPELGMNRALVTRSTTGRLCSGDITEVVDPTSGFYFGGCALGEFTPYRTASR